MWCNISNIANAKTYGEGEVKLSKRSVEHFIKYIRGKNNEVPVNFYITLDGFYSTYYYCKTGNCTPSFSKEIRECEKSSGKTCKLFAKGRYIKWKNGINPGKGKVSKISSKMTDAQIYAKLTEFGFYKKIKIENSFGKSKREFEEKLAKDKMLAQKKAAKEKKIVEEKVAKEKKITEQKVAEEKKIAEEKAAKEKKIVEEKVVKEKKIAEQKAAEEKLDKKLSLITVETDLEKAQNFLKNLQEFIKLYPDEFDIIKVSEFFILTRPVLDGDLNYKSKKDLEQFKEFTNTSDLFVKYNNDIEKGQRDKNLNKINDAILSLENNIKIIKGFLVMDQNSIYLEEWLGSIKNALIVIDNPSSYDQLLTTNDDLIKLIKQK